MIDPWFNEVDLANQDWEWEARQPYQCTRCEKNVLTREITFLSGDEAVCKACYDYYRETGQI